MFTRSQVPGRTKGKMAVDILMTAVLLGLMTYSFIGEKAHEGLGMAMVFLFILHLILNRSWFLGLGRGKYTPYRVFQTMITILIFSTMIGLYGQRDPDLPVSFFWMDTADEFMRQLLWLIFSARIGVLY